MCQLLLLLMPSLRGSNPNCISHASGTLIRPPDRFTVKSYQILCPGIGRVAKRTHPLNHCCIVEILPQYWTVIRDSTFDDNCLSKRPTFSPVFHFYDWSVSSETVHIKEATPRDNILWDGALPVVNSAPRWQH